MLQTLDLFQTNPVHKMDTVHFKVMAQTIAPLATEGERQERIGTLLVVEVWNAVTMSYSHGD